MAISVIILFSSSQQQDFVSPEMIDTSPLLMVNLVDNGAAYNVMINSQWLII